VKRILLPAFLVALAFAVASCGGDDKQDGAAPAAATSEPAQPEQPATGTSEPADEQPSSAKNGDGGSSASDAERAAGEDSASAPAKEDASKQAEPAERKSKRKVTPQERIASLSPTERRKLHQDLYEQGKRICAAYGPEELAKSINLPNRDPQTVARLYARAYEAATPSLALPYQQGCLVGFKRFARKQAGN
jgi:hypothetical protein